MIVEQLSTIVMGECKHMRRLLSTLLLSVTFFGVAPLSAAHADEPNTLDPLGTATAPASDTAEGVIHVVHGLPGCC